MTDTPVLLDINGPIATITFNRPAYLNAIDEALAEAFRDACEIVATTADLRVVVLRGAGRGFMAGGDLSRFHAQPGNGPAVADSLLIPLHAGLLRLASIPQPVIASLHGPVAGAGMSVALACDLAIAADDAKFTLAYARVGTSADGSATWSLPRIVGLRKALEIALLADTIDATEALRLGLINQIVPAADLTRRTNVLAHRLAAGPLVAYGHIKRLMRASLDNDLPTQMAAERTAFHTCAATADFAEGVAAFREKRPATFVGR